MRCLARIARLKNLKLVPVAMREVQGASIVYRGIQVYGFWPSVEYLLDVRPYPNLLPNTVWERAIVRTSASLVLDQPMYIGQFHALYIQNNGDIAVPGVTPTLLDIAIASYKDTPMSETFPWVDDLANAVDLLIAHNNTDSNEKQIAV